MLSSLNKLLKRWSKLYSPYDMQISEVFKYWKTPLYCPRLKQSLAFETILKFYFLSLLISLITIAVLKLNDLMPQRVPDNLDFLNKMVLIIVIGPFMEEALFRLNLKFSLLSMSISITLALYYIFHRIFLYELFPTVLLSLLTGSVIYFSLNNTQFIKKIEEFWIAKFRFIFYFSSLLFGFVHLFNFSPLNSAQILISPFIVIHQIFAGLFFSFIRMSYKNGFLLCLLVHLLWNFFSSIPEILDEIFSFFL